MSNRQKPKGNLTTLGSQPHRRPPHIEAWCEEQRAARTPHHGLNAYSCDTCGLVTVTIDVDPGVTPMFLACRRTPGCRGMGTSAGYPAGPPPDTLPAPAWEWATPSYRAYREMDTIGRAHIDAGGLELVPRSGRPSAYLGDAS